MTQTSIGFMVLITGVFAFISSFFAIQSTFKSNAAAFFIACVYSVAIMAFDREIVSATNKWALALRVPFAILIGLVISFPLEMKLLEGRITAQIMKDVEERNMPAIKEIDRIGKMDKDQRDDFSKAITLFEKRYDYLSKQFAEEARIITVGPRALALEREKDSVKRIIDEKKKDLREFKLPDHIIEEKKNLEKMIVLEKNSATDFLSQMEALDNITKKSGSALVLSWVLRLFFVTLELIPTLIKLFIKYNEYHAYLESRRELNVTKFHAYTNHIIKELEQNPMQAVNHPEYTDEMEKMMEDPVYLTNAQLKVPKTP
jgi:ABC-type transport system involved in multi-copper enzyme maturation permease subunit